jgi:hypothetical protein
MGLPDPDHDADRSGDHPRRMRPVVATPSAGRLADRLTPTQRGTIAQDGSLSVFRCSATNMGRGWLVERGRPRQDDKGPRD